MKSETRHPVPRILDVLIVEDDEMSRRAMTALMVGHGYVAESVSSAEEGLKRVEQGTAPRIALIDLDLPGMSGMDFIQKLAKVGSHIFPVLITAADRDRVSRIQRDNVFGYLQKPINVEQLFSIIHSRS